MKKILNIIIVLLILVNNLFTSLVFVQDVYAQDNTETENFVDFILEKESFSYSEQPEIKVKLKENFFARLENIFRDTNEELEIKIFDPIGILLNDIEIRRGEKEYLIHLDNKNLKPGKYKVEVKNKDGEVEIQEFTWGVLAINTDKYEYISGEPINIEMAVLDEKGDMVCDADLILNITDATGVTIELSTDKGGIKVNENVCKSKDLTITPDYSAIYSASVVGEYKMDLKAITGKGEYSTSSLFKVVESSDFNLKRITATRIFPGNIYPVIFSFTAKKDYKGVFSEELSTNFKASSLTSPEITSWTKVGEIEKIFDNKFEEVLVDGKKFLNWDVDFKAGVTYFFGYKYDAPDESPALYILGPTKTDTWNEQRNWFIAIDSVDPVVGMFSNVTNSWTSAADANLALRQPDPESGDLMIATIAIRPSASTVDTPSGWTSAGSWTGTDGGAEGADTGSVRLYWFYKVADGTEGTSTQTFTESGTTSVWMGNIVKFRSATGTYDVSAAGYSINGDATNWNGTLDSDIGLRSGDIFLIAGAQNGDLSAASGYALSATNVNVVSTVREYGEFASTTGNGVEIDFAQGMVWEGNNTTTPTVTFTQGTASSGAVSVIRIRQGSGTNRTDTWVRSTGLRATGTTSLAIPYSDHDPGDMLVIFIMSRGTTDPTPATPTGWTSLGSYNGGSGAFGADSGNARITGFYQQTFSRNTGNTAAIAITGANASLGQMYTVHRDDVDNFTIATDGGTDTSAGTSWSVTGSGLILNSTDGGDVVLIGSSINTDAVNFESYSLTSSGVTIGTTNEDSWHNNGTGNDISMHTASTDITSGSGSSAPTYTMTGNTSGAAYPTGATMIVKVLGNTQTDVSGHLGFFSPPETWLPSTTGDANLVLSQPDPRNGDLMIATIVIRPAASTVNTPSGWTLLDSRTGTDGGAEGADTGSVGLYTFYKVADGTEGTTTVTFTETGTTSVWIGNIMKVRSATGTYDLDSAGYSINGDTTTWGGTLDSDPGLAPGDLVILAAAQNGDLSNTSAWNTSATGITQIATTNEHGEFGSTSGNDIEVGIATTLIWEGTNSATPTTTITQSAAASGVVAFIRIRQGSGTNRTDTWVRASGPQIAGTTSLAVAYPEHEVGDLFVLFVVNRGSTDPSALTPSGWTSLGTYSGGAGAFGADAGNARTTAFYREATSRRFGTQTVSIPSGDTAVGQMISLRREDVQSWTLDSDGGTDTSAGTSWSVTGSGIDLNGDDGGDIVLVGSSINTDARTYTSHALSASGITFGEVTQTSQFRTSTGNDMSLIVATGRVTSGTANGVVPTFTMTGSGSGTNDPAGSSLFVKIYAQTPDVPSNTTFTLSSYRWYVDPDSLDVTDAWSAVSGIDLAENTEITSVPVSYDAPDSSQELRLRVSFTVNTDDLVAAAKQFKLQYRVASDSSCSSGSWTDLGGSNAWVYATSGITDGTTIVTPRLTSSDVGGQYSKSAPTTANVNTATVGQDIEYDFHIVGGNDFTAATRYIFRVVEDDDTLFDSYVNCPALTTEPNSTLFMRHGNFFTNSGKQGFWWAK